MRIAYLTAGAAGMYCGSCLHDNALAKALIQRGHDVVLIPTYTPILTDEASVSTDRLFYGGLNVYLQQLSPIFRWIPKRWDQFLSSPRLVNWIASRSMGTSARQLGGLTVSMLQGKNGKQRKEVDRLCDWLEAERPDVAIFSNLLIAGCIGEIKRRIGCPVVVMLQGDDIFFESLIEPYKTQALGLLRELAGRVDRFVVHSEFYGRRMQQLLGFAEDRCSINPLSLDTNDFVEWSPPDAGSERPPTIGYLARIAPEKGLHLLVEAFLLLSQEYPAVRLEIAGWLGQQNQAYWDQLETRLRQSPAADRFRFRGTVDRAGKLQLLQEIDVLCVPTVYQEPKGLFVLESLAAGVPVVQPEHGAFPELIQRLGGGHLTTPNDSDRLAQRLKLVLADLPAARRLGWEGRQAVLGTATTGHAAVRLEEILNGLKPQAKVKEEQGD